MQKRITALNPGLILGAILSIGLHGALFHEGWLDALAQESKLAEVIMDSGTIAVELTLMPSIASTATPEPHPPVEEEAPPDPEPTEEKIIEEVVAPIVPLPAPIVNEPSIIQPQEVKKPMPLEPAPEPEKIETAPEPQPEMPEPSIDSIEQDGSLEEDKGAITEAVSENTTRAAYPPLSRRRGEKGSVILSFDISEKGKISNIQVVQSSGHKRLDKAAIKAISKARFKPAIQRGEPIASTLTQTFNFRLTND